MSVDHEWDGVERRQAPMEDLVTRAASIAAQNVGAIHRRRLVVWSFLAALLASAAICVPVVLIVSHSNRVTAHNNSAYNCDLLKRIAELSARKADYFQAFLISDAQLRRKQSHYRHRQRILTAFSAIIEPKLLRELQTRSDRLDRHARRFWQLRLAPKMHDVATQTRALAKVNCDAVLDGKTATATPTP